MWVIFLFFLMGWGGNGWGGFGNRGGQSTYDLGNLINNDNGRDLLMQAIHGNADAISQLSTTLNCDINSINSAINAVMSSVQGVGNQVGMSSQQIINAIQAGNGMVASKLADCCCENRLAISQQTNALQNSISGVSSAQDRGFAAVAYATQQQTCDIQNSIKDATDKIIAGQTAAEMREMQNKIDSLRELNSQKDVIINNGQQTAVFSQMIQGATAPIASALNTLQTEVNNFKCRLPETVTLPYSCATAVPTNALYAWAGYNAFGNNSLWG